MKRVWKKLLVGCFLSILIAVPGMTALCAEKYDEETSYAEDFG